MTFHQQIKMACVRIPIKVESMRAVSQNRGDVQGETNKTLSSKPETVSVFLFRSSLLLHKGRG